MHPLIGIHAALGEAGALAFLWVIVELLNPNGSRLRRARIASLLGLALLIGAWFVGGYYYITEYSVAVKPLIKSGPMPWAHSVITETKEHVFLFLPLLAVLTVGLLQRFGDEFVQNRNYRLAVILASALIVLIAFTIAGMGFVISSGFRAALEAQVI